MNDRHDFGITPLLIDALTIPQQAYRTEDERNTIDVFSKAKLGVVHIKARQQGATEFGAHQHSENTGSGFLVDRNGHVLTNYHVIESANWIEVYLPDGIGMGALRRFPIAG